MPKGGLYFDAIIRQEPINDDNLHVEDNTEEFSVFSDREIELYSFIAAAPTSFTRRRIRPWCLTWASSHSATSRAFPGRD
jgi:hypothetical protein